MDSEQELAMSEFEQGVAASLHQIAKSLKKIEDHLSVMIADPKAKIDGATGNPIE